MICNKLITLDAPCQFGRAKKPIIPAIIGAAAALTAAGISAASQYSTNIANANLSKDNRDWNEDIMEKQNQWNIDMFNRTNEYNSASSQVQRLKAAGLNPYLMMDGGNAGIASSLQSASPGSSNSAIPYQSFDASSLSSGLTDAAGLMQQEKLIDAQTRATNAQAFTSEINNKTQDVRNTWEIGKLINDGKNSAAQAAFNAFKTEQGYALLSGQIANQSIQNDYLLQQKVQSQAQTQLLRYQSALSSSELSFMPARVKAELAKYAAETYAAEQAGFCSSKQADLLISQKYSETLRQAGLHNEKKNADYVTSKLRHEANKAKWDANLSFQNGRYAYWEANQAKSDYQTTQHTQPYLGKYLATPWMRSTNTLLQPLRGILSGGVTKTFK